MEQARGRRGSDAEHSLAGPAVRGSRHSKTTVAESAARAHGAAKRWQHADSDDDEDQGGRDGAQVFESLRSTGQVRRISISDGSKVAPPVRVYDMHVDYIDALEASVGSTMLFTAAGQTWRSGRQRSVAAADSARGAARAGNDPDADDGGDAVAPPMGVTVTLSARMPLAAGGGDAAPAGAAGEPAEAAWSPAGSAGTPREAVDPAELGGLGALSQTMFGRRSVSGAARDAGGGRGEAPPSHADASPAASSVSAGGEAAVSVSGDADFAPRRRISGFEATPLDPAEGAEAALTASGRSAGAARAEGEDRTSVDLGARLDLAAAPAALPADLAQPSVASGRIVVAAPVGEAPVRDSGEALVAGSRGSADARASELTPAARGPATAAAVSAVAVDARCEDVDPERANKLILLQLSSRLAALQVPQRAAEASPPANAALKPVSGGPGARYLGPVRGGSKGPANGLAVSSAAARPAAAVQPSAGVSTYLGPRPIRRAAAVGPAAASVLPAVAAADDTASNAAAAAAIAGSGAGSAGSAASRGSGGDSALAAARRACAECEANVERGAHYAAYVGHVTCLEVLVERDGCVPADSLGRSPLFYAAARGHGPCVALLVDVRPEWMDAGDNGGDTPLHIAACRGHTEVVQLLLGSGATPTLANLKGLTPAHVAASATCLGALLECGASPAVVDAAGRTPLFTMCAAGRASAAALLCELDGGGEALRIVDARGDTPLHAAACNGHRDCVRLLLVYGARVDAVNNAGLRPIDLAYANRRVRTCELLREAAAGAGVGAGPDTGVGAAGTGDGANQRPAVVSLVIDDCGAPAIAAALAAPAGGASTLGGVHSATPARRARRADLAVNTAAAVVPAPATVADALAVAAVSTAALAGVAIAPLRMAPKRSVARRQPDGASPVSPAAAATAFCPPDERAYRTRLAAMMRLPAIAVVELVAVGRGAGAGAGAGGAAYTIAASTPMGNATPVQHPFVRTAAAGRAGGAAAAAAFTPALSVSGVRKAARAEVGVASPSPSPPRAFFPEVDSAVASGAGEWTQYTDEASGQPYFYNARTGASQWGLPTRFAVA